MRPTRNSKLIRYGLQWPEVTPDLTIEFYMVRNGGRWKGAKGQMLGQGLEFHFTQAMKLVWPRIIHHRWLEMFIKEYLRRRTVIAVGPASSGKSFAAAICGLLDYYIFPSQTTGVYCSTTLQLLRQRIWGEVIGLHGEAQTLHENLPGRLIRSQDRIVTDDRQEYVEVQDFRNGLLGVACSDANVFSVLKSFAGIKNKRVRLYGDELSLLPLGFVDAISNLDKNDDFKCVCMGNPKDINDALGKLAEPAAHLGGWDGGIDQSPHSKTWEIRRPQGVCVQFVGTDSPNLDGKLGCPLLTKDAIDRDVAFYGTDSLWYTMMNQGMMPRGQGSRRVITRMEAEKHGAKRLPVWRNSNRVRGASLDAAYGGVGGDRCILTFWEFGDEIPQNDPQGAVNMSLFVDQPNPDAPKRHVFAITETMLVPIKNDSTDPPTDQIAKFVMGECEKRGVVPNNFFYDSGMRTALVQAFMRLWSKDVNSIDCGGPARSDRKVSADIDVLCSDYYSKFITELWFSVRMIILSGQFRGLTEGALTELSSREWTMVGANKTEVETKEKMKKKIGRSPDEADCVAIAVEGARQRGFVIKRLEPPKESIRDDRWKREAQDRAASFWNTGAMVEAN